MDRVIVPPAGAAGPPVFTDGFGTRFLLFDSEAGQAGDPIEVLSFDPALVDAPYFAATVGARVARVASTRHTLFARVRRLDRPSPQTLLLVSDRVAGWRLANVLDVLERENTTLDISAVLSLLRQLIPAVALFARHQRDMAVGTIAPERLILTPQGRLVLAEYVLGEAMDKLSLTRDHLWRTYRVPIAVIPGEPRNSPRSDVLAIGIVVLSLLLGRRLREDEFPGSLADLLQHARESSGGSARPLSERLSQWLGRALQLDGRTGFQVPQEVQVAFEEVLASERGYVTTPALLDAFLARLATTAGPPPEPVRPIEEPPPAVTLQEPEPELEVEPEPEPEPEPPPEPKRRWRGRKKTEPVREPEPLVTPTPEPPQRSSWAQEPAPYQETGSAYRERISSYGGPSPTPAIGPDPNANPEPAFVEARRQRPPAPRPTPAPAPEWTPVREEPTVEPAVRLRVGGETRSWITKALAGVALLAVLEAAAIIWLWNRSSAALLRQGELSVQSRPTAARVTLDDDDLGVTPVTVRLAPGTYTLKVQVGKAEPRVIVVQIRAGVQTAQYLELQTGR